MHLIRGKSIEEISEQDLLSLIENKTPESKFIEYKLTLPGNSDKNKKEFLADVSSFSNAAGGHIIFGISAKGGIPQKLVGLENIDPDSEILRLDNILRDAIAPRLPGVGIKSIPLSNRGPAFINRIPRSWISPHMVIYGGSSKFYSRNSAGKYQLDVFELRTAFAATSVESNRIREFHINRIGKIVAGETPIAIEKGPRIVLHIIPLGVFESRINYDLTEMQLSENRQHLAPIDASYGSNFRFNFDGVLTFERPDHSKPATNYFQLFRNGIIESACTTLFTYRTDTPAIPSDGFEEELVKALSRYLSLYSELEVEPPVFIMLSLLGVSGFALPYKRNDYFDIQLNMIDRNDLIVPEIFVEDLSQPPEQIIRPAFDAVWNAAGLLNSPYYDSDGNWNTRRRG
ncbi:MAG: ATP-binding protein [Planctomycetes bacterium]|nr:ATP-binding protein [Planctomycetota bacterium]